MIEQRLRKFYESLPENRKKLIRGVFSWRSFIPFLRAYHKRRWVKGVYSQFGQDQRSFIFLSIARFCNINRPIEGYYFEFGSFGGNTMRKALDNFRWLFDFTYVAFDSFEGLPEIQSIDKQKIWVKGKLMVAEQEFAQKMLHYGLPEDKFFTVKGFYDQSLTDELKQKLLPKKAAVIYIDCDLYASTIPVLEFIKDFLQKGTIIVIDDWNCFYGDPEKGERLAFRQFCEKYPNLRFEEFVQTNEGKAFIFLGSNG
ncbi:MAG: hypothetical protein NTV62_00565, partial [Candidatus Gribaldobacteria bacterium]|nr:hypothetical protein [Candidatus Gribaldobacteria bacterium]